MAGVQPTSKPWPAFHPRRGRMSAPLMRMAIRRSSTSFSPESSPNIVYYSPKESTHRHSSDKNESISKLKLQEEERPEHPPTPEESSFRDSYDIGQIIGQGATSSVYVAKKKNSDGRFAVKIIPSKTVSSGLTLTKSYFLTQMKILSDSFSTIAREIQILKRLHHPNVITLHDAIITSKNLYIIMDLLRGPELFDVMVDRKSFPELEARGLVRKIMKAVAYLHSENIAHRDIKPENIKFQYDSTDTDLKILDFGFARHLKTDEKLQNQVGTICYEAPEILKGFNHTYSVDVWAVGIISYIMLCGFPPFFSNKDHETDPDSLQRYPFWLFFNDDTPHLRNSIMEGKFDFPSPYWDNITPEGKDLITKLLTVDPAERITAEFSLSHPWFKLPEEAFAQPDCPDLADLQKERNPREVLTRFLQRRPSAKDLQQNHILVNNTEGISDRIAAKQHELWIVKRKQTLYRKLQNRLTPQNSPILKSALSQRSLGNSSDDWPSPPPSP